MGVYMIFFPRVRISLVIAPVLAGIKTTALVGIGVWLLEQVVLAFFLQSGGMEDYVGVAFWAHVGGLLTGVGLGYYLVLLDVKKRFERKLKRFKKV